MVDKDTLTQQFQAYLETVPWVQQDTTQDVEQKTTDLFDLFTELAALKSEVKRESRQIQSALDTFKSVFETLQASQQQLRSELDRNKKEQRDARAELLKPLLLDCLSIRDGMVAALEGIDAGIKQSRRGGVLAWFKRAELRRIDHIREGQAISLRRLEERLVQQGVNKIEVVGQRFDPQFMCVVAIESDHGALADGSREIGQVTEELRSGFTWDGELLRLAEVTVLKV